jgi:scyllo-inositol 2-dehydrogenase (NAD+)
MSLNTALIGAGRMGAEPSARFENQIPDGWLPISHAESIQSTPGLNLIALCDVSEQRLSQCAEHYGVKKLYSDYRVLIDKVRPEVLSIATRTNIRCDVIRYGLENGVKGFYAEKPFSNTLKDCRETLAKIEQHGAKIVYGTTRRAMDVYKKAKQICWSGELGDIREISLEFGRSPLLWTLPHATDLITYFADSTDVEFIQGYCTMDDNTSTDNLIIDCDPIVENAFFKFSNGISATINQGGVLNVRIFCSKGNLTVHGNGYSIEINRNKQFKDYFHSIEEIKVESIKSGTQYMMEDLANSISFNTPVKIIKPKEIFCGHQLLVGILESTLRGGARVSPGDLNDDLYITGRNGANFA